MSNAETTKNTSQHDIIPGFTDSDSMSSVSAASKFRHVGIRLLLGELPRVNVDSLRESSILELTSNVG